MTLTKVDREELALALLLWKDFKSQGKIKIEITKHALYFAKTLKVEKEFNELHSKVPPMEIKIRET